MATVESLILNGLSSHGISMNLLKGALTLDNGLENMTLQPDLVLFKVQHNAMLSHEYCFYYGIILVNVYHVKVVVSQEVSQLELCEKVEVNLQPAFYHPQLKGHGFFQLMDLQVHGNGELWGSQIGGAFQVQ
jgi:hypothetical protein